MRKDDLNYLL